MTAETIGRLLSNRALHQLIVCDVPADIVVAYHDDGPGIDEAIDLLKRLSGIDDEALSLGAQVNLESLLAARARHRDP